MGDFIYELLGPGGALARGRTDYEYRPQQVELAQAIAQHLRGGGVLLAEAGTGTGKTLAYLAAIADGDRPVVISTGTTNLQDQLLERDIPLLEKTLGWSLSAVALKGIGNYVCRRKLDEARRGLGLLSPADAEAVQHIEHWARQSASGDRAECTAVAADHSVWGHVCADSATRVGAACPFHEACFVTKARQAAQSARIVVVNHHLFFADLALRQRGTGILPEYHAVIFDEAHHIEGTATEFFGSRVSAAQLEELSRDCRRFVESNPRFDGSDRASGLDAVQALAKSCQGFFTRLRDSGVGSGRVPLSPEDLSGDVEQAYWRLDAALEGLASWIGRVASTDDGLKACRRRCEAFRDDLADILAQSNRASVYWKELGRTVAVGASPIDVAGRLRERVFWDVEAVILTSATLAVNGNFQYVKDRLGIDFDVTELALPSSFDFTTQAALFLPEHAPDPRRPEYHETFASLVVQTFEILSGGALVLFTNARDMARVAGLVRRDATWPVRVQGERPRAALVSELRAAEEPMMLFATASFWEGVDIPGSALQLVAIARLPFASPADPLVAARLRSLQEQGRNPFMEYQVPQACLTLKQGFGRLIRSQRDRGVVAVFDGRIRKMGYGKAFLRSLPPCPVVPTLDELSLWWRGEDGEPDLNALDEPGPTG